MRIDADMLKSNIAFSVAFSCFVAVLTVCFGTIPSLKLRSGKSCCVLILLLLLVVNMEETSALVRPARTRKPLAVYTPLKPGTENETHRVSYALNRKKTLKKKLEATEREWNVKIENKSGTLVLEFTPAPY